MLDRRQFLLIGSTITLAGVIQAKPSDILPLCLQKKSSLRSITYNIRKCKGSQDVDADPVLIESARPQMPLRIALELALYRPDIITFQEAPDESHIARIADVLNMNYVFFPGGDGNPGALLTHWTIIESQNCPLKNYSTRPAELFTRHWGRAVLETPVGKLVVYSAHLWPYEKGNDGREVEEILAIMEPDIRQGRSILFQGDLNHTPAGSEYEKWKLAGLIDTFAERGVGNAFTCSNPDTRACPAPNERIDYIWAYGPIASQLQQCRVLFERAFRNHPDDPKSFALSDHLPVLADFGEKSD